MQKRMAQIKAITAVKGASTVVSESIVGLGGESHKESATWRPTTPAETTSMTNFK